MCMYEGYGVNLFGVKWVDDVNKKVVEIYPSMKEEYLGYCKKNSLDPEGGYENRFIRHILKEEGDEFGDLLEFLINKTEYDGSYVFQYNDHVLHVPATLPKDEERRELIPTQEDIDRICEKHLKPLLSSYIEPGWLYIRCEE